MERDSESFRRHSVPLLTQMHLQGWGYVTQGWRIQAGARWEEKGNHELPFAMHGELEASPPVSKLEF